MRYAIVSNPVCGNMDPDQKVRVLSGPSAVLGARIYGMDTASAEEFSELARDVAKQVDVLVIAGGDGSLSRAVNAIDLSGTSVAFLPIGTGNAMKRALGCSNNLNLEAMRIKQGPIQGYDLVGCKRKRKAFMASIGIEGQVLRISARSLSKAKSGLKRYIFCVLRAYFKEYKPGSAEITLNGTTIRIPQLLSLMVVKQPFYGFGMKLVPNACLSDGRLHVRWFKPGLFLNGLAAAASFTMGNPFGDYRVAWHAEVHLDRPLDVQIDGDLGWKADRFSFEILPKVLRMKGQ